MSDEPPFKKTILSVPIPNQTVLAAKGQERAEQDAGIVRELSRYGKTGEINLTCDENTRGLAMQVAIRGRDFMANYGVEEDVLTACMDVVAVHLNYQPLQLLSFALTSDVADFAHDYSRIRRLINRTTGRLPDGTELKFAEKPTISH